MFGPAECAAGGVAGVCLDPERTGRLPEAERQRMLAQRHSGEAMAEGGGYRGLLRSPSMWGLAVSQGCAVYSIYLYLGWLPNYLQAVRGSSIVPVYIGADSGRRGGDHSDELDRRCDPNAATMRCDSRRIVVVACLLRKPTLDL
jgi:hypothetical protein